VDQTSATHPTVRRQARKSASRPKYSWRTQSRGLLTGHSLPGMTDRALPFHPTVVASRAEPAVHCARCDQSGRCRCLAATGRIVQHLDPNAGPTGIDLGAGAMWVTDNEADNVTRVDPTGPREPHPHRSRPERNRGGATVARGWPTSATTRSSGSIRAPGL
jgi:hypothetical protein